VERRLSIRVELRVEMSHEGVESSRSGMTSKTSRGRFSERVAAVGRCMADIEAAADSEWKSGRSHELRTPRRGRLQMRAERWHRRLPAKRKRKDGGNRRFMRVPSVH
jgi:hypothetical protein